MERCKKITIILILMFVHVFIGIHVYFSPERSIIFGRGKTIAIAKAEVKQVVHERYKSLADKHPAPLFLSTYITNEKYQNHNIYTEKIIICNNIEEKQLARKDLSGDDSIPVYSYENMI